MYAIIKNGGKQYKVTEGDELSLDKMSLEAGTTIEIKEVLAVNAGELKFGAPFVEGAIVTAEVMREGRDRKVITFKKRRRKDSKVKRGFRRDFTRVKITKIAA
ncbi:50S ribosomal protein L21 [Sulfurimonas aquatica]|uniref:Large ribosomal subunit protein bL21 n=1 Tax=Sulfurimonas aquatica TaxID=2672570 RepID=A0A975B138_9BACT|nr:50S ribosomal protein L21 [Sulfurimonas aquatica]QSZ42269.1 50S ribosomal protein L21 [Sulfurimonas aquatica]